MNFDTPEAAFKYIWYNHQVKFKDVTKIGPKMSKSDIHAEVIKEMANKLYTSKDLRKSHLYYCLGLKVAEPGGAVYGILLANLSALHFTMGYYKECIEFIRLCKETAYEKSSYPKLFIREIKALRKLGENSKASEVLIKTLQYIRKCKIPKHEKDKYIKEANEANSLTKEEPKNINDDNYIIPLINQNKQFPNITSKAEIIYSKEFGNHVVAKEKIERGEAILVENPYALFANREFCSHCFKICTYTFPCKICKINVYCSENCRDFDWEEMHKWECTFFTYQIFDVVDANVVLAIKIFIKACNIKAKKQFQDITNNKFLPQLLDLYEDFHYVSKDKNALFQCGLWCCHFVLYLFDYTNFYDWAVDNNIFGRLSKKNVKNFVGGYLLNTINMLHFNSSKFSTKYDTNALAIYLSLSKFNHACLSNTTQYYSGSTVVIKAYQDIKPGEQIFITMKEHDYSLAFTQMRQEQIKQKYNFICKCLACTDLNYDMAVFDGMKCTKCKSISKRLTVYDHKCLKCGHAEILNEEFMGRIQNISQLLAQNELTGSKECLDTALKLVDTLNLHPNNFIILQCHIDQAIHEMKLGNVEQSFLHYSNFKKINHKSGKSFTLQVKMYFTFETFLKQLIYSVDPLKKNFKPTTITKMKDFLKEFEDLMWLYFPMNGLLKNMKVLLQFLEMIDHFQEFKDETSSLQWLRVRDDLF